MAGRKQRGRGGGRGYRGGRGFPRGGDRGGRGGGRGRGRGGGVGYMAMHEIDGDFVIETLPFHLRDNSRRGATPPRGYKRAGKGRGFGFDYEQDYSDSVDNSDYYYSRYSAPVQGISPVPGSSRGNGYRRGRGRWGIAGPDLEPKDRWRKRHLEAKLRNGNASLSQLLYEDRPFLKPITFVRSQVTPTLFLRDEEIFKPVAEEAGEQEASHVPTAERVYRIFHGGNVVPQPSEPLSDEEELLEIDYADLGRFINEVEATAASSTNTKTTAPVAIDITTSVRDEAQPVVTTTEEGPTDFYIDTKPSPVQDSSTSTNGIAVEYPGTGILGEGDDDEIIVYVAPHPRNGKLASAQNQSSPTDARAPPRPADPASVATPVRQKTYDAPHAPALQPEPEPKLWPVVPKDVAVPAPSPAPALAFKNFSFSLLSSSPKPTHRARWPRRIARRKAERNMMFGSFGAIRAEATLRELDPRRAEQRRGDSDVDWGGSTSGVAEVEDSEEEEDGGMLVDQDIGTDAMAAFVRGMGVSGQAHITAGDLEDEGRIRLEDADEDEEEDESDSGSDGEDVDTELELADGVRMLAAEGDDDDDEASRSSSADDDDDDTSEDQEVTPKRSFQARLEQIRSRTVGRPVKDMMREELDQEQEEFGEDPNLDSDSDIEDEDSIVAQIQDFLDENDDILRAKDHKQIKRIFRAIRNGDFGVDLDDFIDSSPKRKRDKHVPAELRDQWERDHAKKAERKRLRELERIAAAADPFTRTKKKRRGKKERKAAQKAAASISLETVVGHMRRFVEDLGSSQTLSLPPMERHTRKSVHELANAFNLKSKSEGKGAARFTRLIKTTRSGVRIDERKVAQILGKPPPRGGGDKGKGKGKAGSKIRPRDGELVGGAAPKIDGSNLGFKMLASMGWEEGSRIGTVGGVGLDIPLVAVVKTTKLGLGASSHKG